MAGLSSPVAELSPVSPSFWPNRDHAIADSSALNEVVEQDGKEIFGASTNHGLRISGDSIVIGGGVNDSVDFAREQTSAGNKPLLRSRCLLSAGISRVLFYLDSGAGQSLSSCITAFITMMPCQVEITGIAGALQIYGCGTALFLFDDDSGQPILLRVHNCLYGHGEFNLLSVSQICQREGNSIDFALESPKLVLRAKKRLLRIPLFLEDGLFAISVVPFQMDDPRYQTLQKVDVTPSGVFRLSDDSRSSHRWSSRVLVSASTTARILAAPHADYHCNLESFCGNFLAPPSIPVARRQYNPTEADDMVELTTRFLGLGDERLRRTI
jgi:hypothetical protein